MTFAIRPASLADVSAITALIAISARQVGIERYTPVQMDAALRGTFGVDTELIRDQTYFVIETASGALAACGGWSRRRTLFGGDDRKDRESGSLDPKVDAAKIRAFFVHPDHLRKGLASLLLARCESKAREAGFERCELMGTLTGVPFYAARGYQALAPVTYEAAAGIALQFVPMIKRLG
jgi:GNAT superfamily N-acetyltransferase